MREFNKSKIKFHTNDVEVMKLVDKFNLVASEEHEKEKNY